MTVAGVTASITGAWCTQHLAKVDIVNEVGKASVLADNRLDTANIKLGSLEAEIKHLQKDSTQILTDMTDVKASLVSLERLVKRRNRPIAIGCPKSSTPESLNPLCPHLRVRWCLYSKAMIFVDKFF